jgi:hypothetical protein
VKVKVKVKASSVDGLWCRSRGKEAVEAVVVVVVVVAVVVSVGCVMCTGRLAGRFGQPARTINTTANGACAMTQ